MIGRKAVLFYVCLILVLPAALFAEKMTANWHLTGYTRYRDAVFADRARRQSPAPDIQTIWIKIAPSPKSKYRQTIRQYLEAVRRPDARFNSIEILCEIHCAEHLIRFTRFVYLDDARNMIHEADDRKAPWFRINRGSLWYPVSREACPSEEIK